MTRSQSLTVLLVVKDWAVYFSRGQLYVGAVPCPLRRCLYLPNALWSSVVIVIIIFINATHTELAPCFCCSLHNNVVPVAVTSFCNISSVKETQPTSLTCTFNVDVNATKTNFSVVLFDGVDSKGNVYRSGYTFLQIIMINNRSCGKTALASVFNTFWTSSHDL